ncbi:MAG: hypothetical protein IIA36_12965 [Proteobacteria bacterium]|nr:hypothetical protein [Pseudomonadota bacterium]
MPSKQGLKGFRARVAEYFYEDVPIGPAKGREGKGEGTAAKGPGAPAARDEFNERARKLLETFPDPKLTAGKLQVLGLYGLRKHAAAEWDEISDEVQDLIATAMQRHLHPSDIYTRYDDENFFVLFCQRDIGEAEKKTSTIAKEANSFLKRYLAKALPKQKAARDAIDVRGEVAEIDCANAGSGGTIFDVIANGLGVKTTEPADGPVNGGQADGDLVNGPMNGREGAPGLSRHNGQQPAKSRRGGAAGSGRAEERRKYGAPRSRALRGHAFDSSANDVAGQAEELPDDGEAPTDAVLAAAPLVFLPVWGAVQSVVSTYACALPPGAGPAPGMSQADRDRLLLGNIIRGFETYDHRKSSALLIAAVDFQTLTSKDPREKFMDLCRRVPSSSRKFILFEICNLAGYAPWPEANRVWQELQPYCLSIIVRLPLANPVMDGIETPKLYAFSTDLGHLDGKGAAGRADIAAFVGAAEAKGLRTLAHGVNRASVGKWALSAGVAYMSGEAIAPADILPKPTYGYDPFR